jgi:hypothetical protein
MGGFFWTYIELGNLLEAVGKGNPNSMDFALYSYGCQNPVRMIDPDGLFPINFSVKGGAIIGGTISGTYETDTGKFSNIRANYGLYVGIDIKAVKNITNGLGNLSYSNRINIGDQVDFGNNETAVASLSGGVIYGGAISAEFGEINGEGKTNMFADVGVFHLGIAVSLEDSNTPESLVQNIKNFCNGLKELQQFNQDVDDYYKKTTSEKDNK